MSNLELGLIGNCCIGALVDRRARIVWCCIPKFDGDPLFNCLLNEASELEEAEDGVYAIDLEGKPPARPKLTRYALERRVLVGIRRRIRPDNGLGRLVKKVREVCDVLLR